MIRRIHYFSAELKTKIDVIPKGCFKAYSAVTVLGNLTSKVHPRTETVVYIYNGRGPIK